ncbi:MAG: hypothetical protein Q9172_005166 [Xanthocarpia lactea]
MTGPSAGRSRARKSLPLIDVAAKEYVSSNATSAMFLGGQQKSWMTGPREFETSSHKTAAKTNTRQKLGVHQEKSGNQPSLDTTAGDSNPTTALLYYEPASFQSPPAESLCLPTGRVGTPLQKDPAATVHNVETVLPSPALSDEHRSDNLQASDSESDGRIFNVHRSPDQPLSNVQSLGAESINDSGENERLERTLHDALSTVTPPAPDTTTSPTHQPPIQLARASIVRQKPQQGLSEKKRKRTDYGSGARGAESRAPHSQPNNEIPSVTGTSGPSGQPPSGAHMPSFLQILIDRQQQRAMISPPGDTEVARLRLLQRAYIQSDHVYLLLHQIYCMDLTQPGFLEQLQRVGFRGEHFGGLRMLTPLLLPNLERNMEPDAVSWFAQSPLPLGPLLRGYYVYRKALESVKTCLATFGQDWPRYRDSCSKRFYPPLVQELAEGLKTESPVLQGVMFRSILGDIRNGIASDSFSQEMEGLFQQDQHFVQQNGHCQADMQLHNQTLIIKYQQLISNLLSRGRLLAGSQNHICAGPPVDQRRAPPPPNINTQSVHITATTAEHRTTPKVPSQHFLPNQQSSSTPQGSGRGYLISPPIPVSSARSQPSQIRQPSNNGPPAINPTYSSASSHSQTTPVSSIRSPAGWGGPWPASPSILNCSYQMPHAQGNRLPPTPQPPDRAVGMPRPAALPPAGYHKLLLPPAGQKLSTLAQPNPSVIALHQAQGRSPYHTVVDDSGQPTVNIKYFRYIEGVAILHHRLKIGTRQQTEFQFDIGEDDRALLSGTRAGLNGAPSVRNVRLGSRFGRIRCVDATRIADFQRDDQAAWVTANQVWPEYVTVVLNGEHLDIRKKLHYGKDLPIDVTALMKFGSNKLSVSIISPETEDKTEYAIGLETIQIVDTAGVKVLTGVLPYVEAQQRVMRRLQNVEPDIEVVNPSLVINMSDPYTSRIWDIPMRGRGCRHDQCFDLDVFLETRTSKRPGQSCNPDQFRCPICDGDARPQNLVKDEFFEVLRAELAKRNRLDAKAIIMQQDGTWEVQEEEKTGETGDGSGRRRSEVKPHVAASAATKDGNSTRQVEVIEID